MTSVELASALRHLLPQFQVVDGLYLVMLPGIPQPTEEELQREIRSSKGDTKQQEHDMNRCFIIANVLDWLRLDDANRCTSEDLLVIGEVLAALIRDGLKRAFPGEHFDVEIVGAEGVEDEPLELCVTFSRAS